MGVPQRSNASSQVSALVKSGHLVNLIDPRTQKVIKLRNTSGFPAQVRGLPAHQQDASLIQRLSIQMDTESEEKAARRKPPLSTAGVERAISLSKERRRSQRRQRDRRKAAWSKSH
jgi:hypothetical protein